MSVKIVRDVEGVAVEVVSLDAVISHEVQFTATVTEHALEDGSTVADHVIRQPDQITVTGYVSSTPVTILTGGIVPIFSFGRVRTAYQAMKDLLDTKNRVTVSDELDQHTSMVLTELRIPRDVATYNGIQFTATFRKIRLVSSAEVEISADDPIAAPAKDVGSVTPEASTPEETTQSSYLYQIGKGALRLP
jgi:hypothetical protein